MFTNLKIAIAIGLAVAVLAGIAYVYHAGGQAREDKITVKAGKTEGEIQDEKDAIRNHRPDRDGTIARLRSGTF